MNTQTSSPKNSLLLQVIKMVGDAIKEAGSIPAGHLYAMLMPSGCTLEQFDMLISVLKDAGKVREENNQLYWITG